jgi:hypothetical protein
LGRNGNHATPDAHQGADAATEDLPVAPWPPNVPYLDVGDAVRTERGECDDCHRDVNERWIFTSLSLCRRCTALRRRAGMQASSPGGSHTHAREAAAS